MERKVLTQAYLTEKARLLELTPQQKEIFLLKFGKRISNQEIAKRLGISQNACVQCLGEIYKKFGIKGKSRGKAQQLLSLLIGELEELSVTAGLEREILQKNAANPTISKQTSLPALQKDWITPEGDWLQNWIDKAANSVQELNSEEGIINADQTLSEFISSLPTAITTLATRTSYTKAEIASIIIDNTRTLFQKLYPLSKKNKIPELDFIVEGEQPLARSIIAFVSRSLRQFELDSEGYEPWSIIKEAIQEANNNYEQEEIKIHASWIRSLCYKIILQKGKSSKFQQERKVLVKEEKIRRNLKAVETALQTLHLQSKTSVETRSSFEILCMRWFMNISWNRFSEFSAYNFNFTDSNISTKDKQKMIEFKALLALRYQYHALDRFTDSELEEKSQEMNKPIQDSEQQSSLDCCSENAFFHCSISGIPKIFVEDKNFQITEISEQLRLDVLNYCKLASLSILSEETDVECLKLILDRAQKSAALGFWINEVDHFIDHELGISLKGKAIEFEESQKAKLRTAL